MISQSHLREVVMKKLKYIREMNALTQYTIIKEILLNTRLLILL